MSMAAARFVGRKQYRSPDPLRWRAEAANWTRQKISSCVASGDMASEAGFSQEFRPRFVSLQRRSLTDDLRLRSP